MRAVRGACAAVVVLLAVYCVVVALGTTGGRHLPIGVVSVFTGAVIGGCALVCGLRAYRERSDRAAWACVCAGLVSYTAGTLLWQLVLQNRVPPPYPSSADLLWLTLDPLCIVAIWLMVRSRLGRRISALLDGVVAALGVASLATLYVLPGITDDAGASLAAVVTNFAYPLVDLALVASAIGGTAALGAWRERTWLLLTAGFALFTVADTWYLWLVVADTFRPGDWNDVCYLVALVLVTLAALRPGPAGETTAQGRRRDREFLVPLLFGLLPLWVLVAASLRTGRAPLPTVLLAVAGLVALAARTALAIREVVALTDQRRLARTDSLTGLPNRRALYDLLGSGADGAVLIIDLDRFKEINDALGHQVGDELLRRVAERLAATVPAPGLVARLGGDEFAVHLPGTPREEAARTATALLAVLEEPFTVAGTVLHVGGSIGITAPAPGTAVGRALAEADMAMYRAKTARTGFAVYDDADASTAWFRLATVEALRLALDERRLTLHFQPIVDARTRLPASAEALVRWTDPERGPVPPDVFLPLAEHAGLMPTLTRAVLDLAFEEARALRALGHELPISVNLSASDLLDGRLEHEVADRLAAGELPPSAVKIEITESLLVDARGRGGDLLMALRDLGIELLVDDFGTGYSSMAYLHDLPVSTLKVDRSFTSRLGADPRTGVIVSSTIDMAHRLGLDVVAEGVETQEQLDWLRAEGCDLIQGYLTSRPLPAAALHEWLGSVRAVDPSSSGTA
ncbi:bifunctional diguanylate cyclase/phosphodiesterase [Kineosporia sp. J2-2]|uniref:Bifunctional diguanylate cyclase/phosphodiesterase n=1 Tax=Kineosporia corallincola TaxID=2835133 RepID=A0ABS5TN97_9ACTN|nr:bifunctional diguanylate cyclase/phosphodiesterase [Kineosporia corallincola]MBT0771671.1 bifunctional diguanylate cyclase/phosphodiesterase [Kineosporia corallincola]